MPVTTGKTYKKSEFEIIKSGISIFGQLLKNAFFDFNICKVFGTPWRVLKSQSAIL